MLLIQVSAMYSENCFSRSVAASELATARTLDGFHLRAETTGP